MKLEKLMKLGNLGKLEKLMKTFIILKNKETSSFAKWSLQNMVKKRYSSLTV